MVLNSGKYHYLLINKDITNESLELGKKILHAEVEQKLLGIITDKNLNFQSQTKLIVKIDLNKNFIFNSFLKGQFNYCPLI